MSKTCPFKYKDKNYCTYYLCDYPAKEIEGSPSLDLTPLDVAIRKHQEEVYMDKFGHEFKE